jgi:hypothetical protein
METWAAETTDGTWTMGRLEDVGTTWVVTHKPTGIVVDDFMPSLPACRAYIASGEADDDLATEQAKQVPPEPAAEDDEESFWDVTPADWETPAAVDAIALAHVADAITEVTGNDDYDEVADEAARLLRRVPSLAAEAARYGAFAIEWDHLLVIVQAAMQVPPEPRIHAEAGATFPACGWIQQGETVTIDPAAVTCRFCKDTVNANRIVAELALSRPPF